MINIQLMFSSFCLFNYYTVRATFTVYGSGTFKADLVKVNPAVITVFI